ncbi:hypothetical protein M426DRAFT_17496 [Hypoxylon sp. CI-4A]|nr:hypothetical protein M426DRAFT_17496 [Hypoxylon sp. CI-4A]
MANLRQFFPNEKRFKFVRDLKGGAAGILAVFEELDEETQEPAQKFVIKCPKTNNVDWVLSTIDTENRWIESPSGYYSLPVITKKTDTI